MKTSTKTILSILTILLAIFVIAVMVRIGVLNSKIAEVPADTADTVAVAMSSALVFAWRYETGAKDLDGLPKTVVFLDAMYENGKTLSLRIEEVQGSCNAVDPSVDDADMMSGTTKIQCYAAGFGETYKIVKGDDAYQIMRKYIEEGSPETVPVEFKYEKVVEIPLLQ